ncbi:MAG TPA: DUF1326 domain-containing protein [Dehalococcoidia bacterium]|nr:DUF1326 domain-containing protein [Dehalococcoidia bacterium]
MGATWKLEGDALGACSCDWGCPCNFDAAPTKGWCQGGYSFHINDGTFNGTKLDGLNVGFFVKSPGALHLGNVEGLLLVDERADEAQRAALMEIYGGKVGGPFAALAGLLVKVIGPEYVPVQWKFDGPNSHAVYGDRVELRLAAIENPVTGDKSGFTLKMTAGLLTNQAELMKSSTFRVRHPEMSYEHSGQYGETFGFSYKGE